MKLIIDIPEDTYKARQHWVANQKRMVDEVDIAIANGIPLDKIRAEIEQGYCEVEDDYDRGRNMGLYIAMQIIDHYKAESEDKE